MTQFNYLPNTTSDREQMMKTIGISSQEELFNQIPEAIKNITLRIPEAHSEFELEKKLIELAKKNIEIGEYISFMGAGYYNRYIPAIIDNVLSRCEFLTAYTPYQPEVSQGTLQAIYEFQTMICSLTAMDVANASMYDGATATAEAALMASRITKRDKVIVSRAVDPETQQVLKTYLSAPEIEIITIGLDDEGITDIQKLEKEINKEIACVIIQMPNFLGNLEEVRKIEQITHNAGALYITNIDPISVGLIKPPGTYNADIVVGEGQSLGCSLSYGGPGFGFMATRQKYLRQMPGRIVGATVDKTGERAFTLTLQTREQHIRREKATSNICTNHSLNALAASIYLSMLGPAGLKELANICFQRAHYLASKISEIPGFKVPYTNFFSNFIITLPDGTTEENFIRMISEYKILPGVTISAYYDEIPNSLLVSVTETNSEVELFLFINAIREISKQLELED